MFDFLRKLKPTRRREPVASPIAVTFDDLGIRTTFRGAPHEAVAWEDVEVVFIRIEDAFLPFPYWYVGGEGKGVRVPNDAQGGQELFFEGLPRHLPGYADGDASQTVIQAMGAMEGGFLVWKRQAER